MSRANEIAPIACELLARTEADRRPVRLIGLTVSSFVTPGDRQEELLLFPTTETESDERTPSL